jgi:NADH-quinone oxidoreductase subunit M
MNFSYHVGVDGISLFFILLTCLLTPICILASWTNIKTRIKEYLICFLLLESLVIGVFVSLNIIIFYIFFEAVLIPMFFIIGIWGGSNRVYAAFKFFLYTLAGSLLFLLAIIYVYAQTHTTDVIMLSNRLPLVINIEAQKWLWWAFFVAFAIKVPMWPVHTWLPDAHVQAPTAGSVFLAGILLKMGAYGFLRFSLPMLPEASQLYSGFVFLISMVAVIYASIVALMQSDMKKMIAYSSIAHMGLVTIGIFTFNEKGMMGAILQMMSHGFISSALFLSIGVLYDRLHTREIAIYGGLINKMPVFAFFFLFFTMASISLPGTSGFVAELLILMGTYHVNKIVTVLSSTGIILGAVYMLWLYARVVLGEIKNRNIDKITDMNLREVMILLPFVALTLLMGIYPSAFTKYISSTLSQIISSMGGQ